VVIGSVTDLFVGSGVYPSGAVYARFETEEYLEGQGPERFNIAAYGLVVNEAGGLSSPGSLCQVIDTDAVGRRYVLVLGDTETRRDPGYCSGS